MQGQEIHYSSEARAALDELQPEEKLQFVPNRADKRRWGQTAGKYRQPSRLQHAAWHPLRVLNLARGKASIAQRSAWVHRNESPLAPREESA